MILAAQIVIVDDSCIGSQVMYGFVLARNRMWNGHDWEGKSSIGSCINTV